MRIDSSIPYDDLVAYFKEQAIKVKLTRNPDRVYGSISIPSTFIDFEGDHVDQAVKAYRFYFLSAGG